MLNNDSRISRRAAVTSLVAGGTGALALLSGGAAAHAERTGGGRLMPSTAGYFTVPQDGIIAILIGLLLPAVQRVRQPFRLHLADSSGVVHSMTIESQANSEGRVAAFFELRMGDGSVRVVERGTKNVLEIPTLDGILIGLLLPAVQKNGAPLGMLAGSVMITDGTSNTAQILPYIEQQPLYHTGGVNSGAFSVGPFFIPPGGSSAVGLLLPAVQGLHMPHTLLLLDSAGTVIARDMIIGPERSQQGVFSAFYDIQSDPQRAGIRVIRRGDGSVLPMAHQPQPDGILIGLLLPAVQKNGGRVGIIGGSAQMPGGTLNFQEVSGLNNE